MTWKIHSDRFGAMLLVVASLWATPAWGQPADGSSPVAPADLLQAKRLFRAGARAYDAGQFAAAVQAFDQAYEISPRAPLRFSAAQALRRQYTVERDPALLRKAQRYYRAYLDAEKTGKRVKDAAEALEEVEQLLQRLEPAPVDGGEDGEDGERPPPVRPPPSPPATKGTLQVDSNVDGATAIVEGPEGTREVDDLPQWLEVPAGSYRVTLRAKGYDQAQRTVRVEAGRLSLADPPLAEKPGRLTIRSEQGAEVLVDGRPMGRAPLTFDIDSGSHRVVVGIDGHDVFAEDVSVERGGAQTLDAELGMTGTRITAWTFISVGAAAALTGVGFGIAAGREGALAQEIDDLTNAEVGLPRALSVDERDQYNGHISTRDNLARTAGGLIGLGALGTSVGLLLYLLDPPDLYGANTVLEEDGDATGAPAVDLDAALDPGFFGGPGGSVTVRGRF